MYETLLQEMTGLKIEEENSCSINMSQYDSIKKMLENKINKSDLINLNMEVHEIYFNETIEGNNTEQFYLKVEKRKGNKKFKLIRKIQRENHFIKTITKISRKQYLSILEGSIDWMKRSKKALINEFYCKINLFQYKIEKIVKYLYEKFYIKSQKVLILMETDLEKIYSEKIRLCSESNDFHTRVQLSIQGINQTSYQESYLESIIK